MSAEFLSGVIGRSLPPTPETAILWHVPKLVGGRLRKVVALRKVGLRKVAAREAGHRISAKDILTGSSHIHSRDLTIDGRWLGLAILETKNPCQQNADDNCNDYDYSHSYRHSVAIAAGLDDGSCRCRLAVVDNVVAAVVVAATA